MRSENFTAYSPQVQKAFEETLAWLREWGCSRNFGLGTLLPWDEQFVIESLSDSTIYMSYYTIAHLLQGGVVDGSTVGPLGIKPEQLTDAVFDYVFLGKDYPKDSGIAEEALQQMRREFNYWYPMDLRCSGKDLIFNHLTFALYNHGAIWEREEMLPRSMFCNGYILVNGEKMSKQLGNFFMLSEIVAKYSADAARAGLADAGDTIDDANYDENVSNAMISKLFVLEGWMKEEMEKARGIDGAEYGVGWDLFDRIFDNEMNRLAQETHAEFEAMRFKLGLRNGFFDMMTARDEYIVAKKGNTNPHLMARFIYVQLLTLSPICPHFCEHMWQSFREYYATVKNTGEVLSESIVRAHWPEPTKPVDKVLTSLNVYLKACKKSFRDSLNKQMAGKKAKKGKQQKQQPEEEAKKLTACTVVVKKEYPELQQSVLKVLSEFEFDEKNVVQGDFGAAVRAAVDEKERKNAMKFAAWIVGEVKKEGKKALESTMPFDEVQMLRENSEFVFQDLGIESVKVVEVGDEEAADVPATAKDGANPGRPVPFFS